MLPNSVLVLENRCLRHLFTKIRDKETNHIDFKVYSNRLMTILCEEGVATLSKPKSIVTGAGYEYSGEHVSTVDIVAVSIIRAGDSMLDVFTTLVPEAKVGKILIQRNEETAEPTLFYSKIPDLRDKDIILLDPMLATGGIYHDL